MAPLHTCGWLVIPSLYSAAGFIRSTRIPRRCLLIFDTHVCFGFPSRFLSHAHIFIHFVCIYTPTTTTTHAYHTHDIHTIHTSRSVFFFSSLRLLWSFCI
ncbi:hypothetical protein C8J57DRAFT_1377022 [Mycena rebaudengoi]|nr:hypothetical protein C8J57DRAFT_1377022 [Mycena rebaudengoi]